jgi:cell division protein FtsW
MLLSRADKSIVSDWWFSIDRLMLVVILLLMLAGLILSLAASPAEAHRLGVEPLYFFRKHAIFLGPAAVAMIAVSMMTPRQLRRLCLASYGLGLLLMAAALVQGVEKNGAVRWLMIAGLQIQPSEFVKPSFVVLTAWLFSEGARRPDVPALQLSLAMLLAFVALLVVQPDFGQTALIAMIWMCMFFLLGASLRWLAAGAGAALTGLAAAYSTLSHVASRIDRFFNPGAGDTRQTDAALQAFREGGWFGRGPGEGMVKMNLPDSHTDYLFAVVGEEFGVIVCLLIVACYAFIIWRGMGVAFGEPDGFIRLAITGLMMLIGFQTLINMAVNVDLLPAKGMTLPLLSYGGSSLVAMGMGMGMVLGLTRRRPAQERLSRPFAAQGAGRRDRAAASPEEMGI